MLFHKKIGIGQKKKKRLDKRLSTQQRKGDSDIVAESNLVLTSLHLSKDDSSLLSETIGSAVLDSGCNKTVCRLEWYNCVLDTLPDKASKMIKT